MKALSNLLMLPLNLPETAENTLKETKRYNKEYLDLQKDLFKSSENDSRKRSTKDSLSLNAQLQSIKVIQAQFDKEHAPFLQISFTGENIGIKEITLNYNLANLTIIPIKVITQKVTAVLRSPDIFKIPQQKFQKEEITPNNYYVIKRIASIENYSF